MLDGEFTVRAGGRKAVLHSGDHLIIPAGTAHVVAATGDGPGRASVIASPSGFARLITEVGTPDGGTRCCRPHPSTWSILRVSADLGDEILGPPGAMPDSTRTARAGDRATRTNGRADS